MIAFPLILLVGLAMSELASSMPTRFVISRSQLLTSQWGPLLVDIPPLTTKVPPVSLLCCRLPQYAWPLRRSLCRELGWSIDAHIGHLHCHGRQVYGNHRPNLLHFPCDPSSSRPALLFNNSDSCASAKRFHRWEFCNYYRYDRSAPSRNPKRGTEWSGVYLRPLGKYQWLGRSACLYPM
jgi:hypothetical protein